MTRAWVLWIVVACACVCACGSARSNGEERLPDKSAKPSPPAPIASSGSAAPTPSAGSSAAPAPAPVPDAGSPDAAASSCVDLSATFKARVAAASGACTAAADCACFTSIVDSPACAGVTDTASARELNDLATRFRAAGCRLPRQCGPGRCAPKCVDHRCR